MIDRAILWIWRLFVTAALAGICLDPSPEASRTEIALWAAGLGLGASWLWSANPLVSTENEK